MDSSLSILVVDDEAAMRTVVKNLFYAIGIRQVTEASNGVEALALLTANAGQFDLIMCDLYMEKMDGMQLCNSIRNNPTLRSRHIPIIMMTSETNALVLDVVHQVGAARVLNMPISLVELKTTVEKLVGFSLEQSSTKAI